MPIELTAAIAIALAVLGVCGIVVPVLPGSLAILGGLLVWGIFAPSPGSWVVFAVGGVLVGVGAVASYLITGSTLKQRQIPSRSVIVGLVAGVVGLFAIPFVGLPLGFAVGLLLMEYLRVRDFREALGISWVALKSVGLGMLVELGCALLAATVLLLGILLVLLG